ncbi:MAG TPA: hypothetical protein VK457_16495 [Chloroflexota bacterium]|nr:hypothetical protein [Chloroflexota bacterium]
MLIRPAIAADRAEDQTAEILEAGLRAPSAHNAQPWRLRRLGPARFQLLYATADKLDSDPDDRDALLGIGAFVETLALEAGARGWRLTFTPQVARQTRVVSLGDLALSPVSTGATDPLSKHVGRRHTNRQPYDARPLPDALREELLALGCVLMAPEEAAKLVRQAGVMAWGDPRFVRDLKAWTRFGSAVFPDGMTCGCLALSAVDQAFLKLAFRMGSLPTWLARAFAEREVYLTRHSSSVAVLLTPDMEPATLLAQGRKLLRCWVAICGAGWCYQPISVVIDQPTKYRLAERVGAGPVAIFRIGHTSRPAAWSERRPLGALLLKEYGA